MIEKKILIISYKLGTEEGVGGRRWLVYGLELLNKGYDIKFLTYQKTLPHELKDHKDNVFFLKTNYPSVLKSYPKTIYKKLLYRFWVLLLKVVNKGTIFDEAVRTEKQFIHTASTIIKDGDINCVIISGAPFSMLYFGTLLKNKFPQIKLISDYRDGWTQGTGYGIRGLSDRKFQFELNREKEVLKISDDVIVASEDVKKMLYKIAPSKQITVIPNFVDLKQYIKYIAKDEIANNKEIVITHIGSVNIGIEKYWKHFFENIKILSETKNSSIIVQFVGNSNKNLENYVKENNVSNINFLPHVSKMELAKYLNKSDFLVLFKHDEFPDSFPTKFFDYVVFRKPLICYSQTGEVTNEIVENKIGYALTDKTSFKQFSEIFNMDNGFTFNKEYDWSKFSLETNVLKLEKLIQ